MMMAVPYLARMKDEMPIEYKPIVTASIAKQIATNIREAIVNGQLKVDQRLPTEEELAARFSVSRPTIREALKRLAAENLIRSQRGPTGGTFVNRPSQEDLRSILTNATTLLVSLGEFTFEDFHQARLELESACCRLAAHNREEAQLAVMREELDIQRDQTLNDVDFCASDVRFHHAIADATQNSVLKFLMSSVIEAVQPITNMVVFRVRERQTIVAQHKRILAALEARRPAAATDALAEQMDYLRDRYKRALSTRRKRRSA